MKVNILGNSSSVLNQYLAEARDASIQKDPLRFRTNLERMGQIFAYEISRELVYTEKEVITSLGTLTVPVLAKTPVLATIMRAGLPLHNGLLSFFDTAPCAFISAYRKLYKDGNFRLHIQYSSSPELTNETLILSDALIATGRSMVICYKGLLNYGKPAQTNIVSALASVEGIDYLKKNLSLSDLTIWVGAIDDELTAQGFIVPGLGDAGDLAFGLKSD